MALTLPGMDWIRINSYETWLLLVSFLIHVTKYIIRSNVSFCLGSNFELKRDRMSGGTWRGWWQGKQGAADGKGAWSRWWKESMEREQGVADRKGAWSSWTYHIQLESRDGCQSSSVFLFVLTFIQSGPSPQPKNWCHSWAPFTH